VTAQAALWSAFVLYALASGASFAYLSTKKERFSRAMLALLALGLAAHAVAFAARAAAFWAFPENRWFLPVTSFHGALSYMAFALAAAFFVIEGKSRLGILGAFVLPWAAASLGLAVLKADPSVSPLRPELRSYWLNLHPMLLMTAYAALANAFGVALAFLVQERQVKSRKPTELCYRLPPLDELEALNGRIVAWAIPVLAAGLAMGMRWAYEEWGRAWSWDPKETAALVTLAFYAAFLWQRFGGGRRGRRPVLASMLGFACVLLTFFVAEFAAVRHDFLGGGR
jgi:ABC-type transport system involved in cytochrome c biogenesis permease subunit